MAGIYDRIARRVREERKKHALSLEDLAERSDLTASFIGQIERGERKLSVDALDRIAQALDVSAGSLLGDAPKAKGQLSIENRIAALLRNQPADWKKLLLGTLKFYIRNSRKLS